MGFPLFLDDPNYFNGGILIKILKLYLRGLVLQQNKLMHHFLNFRELLFLTIIFFSNGAISQTGCTDPAAANYNPSATNNDGSCTYSITYNTPAHKATFPSALSSSSGVVWTDGKLWTHNDSGNAADIYQVDTSTGVILKTVHIDNATNTDWEDIAADSANIYIGNFGNNNGDRTDLAILKIKKSDIGSGSSVHVNAQTINFSYTDQTSFVSNSSNNYDCESLISIGDSLFIFTKDRGDMQTRVYKMPKTPGTYPLSPYTHFNTGGMITGADYNTVTREIALIGYMNGHLNSFIWLLNDYSGSQFFSGNKRRIEIGSNQQWQTEGITYMGKRRFFISCESAGSIDASLFVTTENWLNTTSISETGNDASFISYPNPAKEILYINTLAKAQYTLSDIYGQEVMTGKLYSEKNEIPIKTVVRGIYMLQVIDDNGGHYLRKLILE